MLSDIGNLLCNLVTRCWAFFQLLENFSCAPYGVVTEPASAGTFQRLQPTKRCIELRSPSPVAAHRQVLLEECAVVAVLLRRILWRRAPRWNQKLHRAAGHTAIVVALPRPEVPGLRHSLGSDGGRDL